MWELFQDIELPLTRVLIAMEQAGIHLDCYRLGEITGKIQDQMEELEACIYELAGEEFNLGSPQQLGRVLFERLGLARQRKTKTGYSTDAKTLEALRDSHPIVGASAQPPRALQAHVHLSAGAAPGGRPGTGRLHTTFHQTVTATGRLSSSDPNLQNIPVRTALGAQIRQCFTAEPGNLLVVADYSQIELRIMAHLSREPALLEAFARGRGHPHAARRPRCSAWPRTRWTPTHRRYAKAVNFGIMYGISAFGLSQNLGIEREEAAAYIERYFERLPRVKAFIEETIDDARRQGYVATVFGRRRPIPELRLGQLPGALAGREAGGQLGHPGQRRRHHQGGHDPLPRPAGEGASRRPAWCCRCTTNWCSRCPRSEARARCGTPWWRRWSAAYPHGAAARGGRGGRARLAGGQVAA